MQVCVVLLLLKESFFLFLFFFWVGYGNAEIDTSDGISSLLAPKFKPVATLSRYMVRSKVNNMSITDMVQEVDGLSIM